MRYKPNVDKIRFSVKSNYDIKGWSLHIYYLNSYKIAREASKLREPVDILFDFIDLLLI